MAADEQDLLQRTQRGDLDAAKEWLYRYGDARTNALIRRFFPGDLPTQEDIAAEARMKALLALEEYAQKGSVAAWYWKIVRNECLQRKRDEKHQAHSLSDGDDIGNYVGDDRALNEFAHVLNRYNHAPMLDAVWLWMKNHCGAHASHAYALFYLHVLEGQTFEVIATLQGFHGKDASQWKDWWNVYVRPHMFAGAITHVMSNVLHSALSMADIKMLAARIAFGKKLPKTAEIADVSANWAIREIGAKYSRIGNVLRSIQLSAQVERCLSACERFDRITHVGLFQAFVLDGQEIHNLRDLGATAALHNCYNSCILPEIMKTVYEHIWENPILSGVSTKCDKDKTR